MPPPRRAPSRKKAGPHASRVGRPPGKSSAQTRAEILAGARRQFERVGYERATNRAIAAEAGVTAAAIYQYFSSKGELYAAVVHETLEELMPRLRAVAEAAPSARAALSAMLREALDNERRRSSMRFLIAVPMEMQRDPEVAEALVAQPGRFFDLVVEIVTRGARNGEIERAKTERVIGLYVAALMGLAAQGAVVPADHAEAALKGFIELLEGTLFDPIK
ncbi:MAG: TetR/AcrR family transcriptional regulator [Myxococcales bacterium]|nr:TetR/AcrR family transcriptional regulator [Myxococcales bacterium]